MQFKRPGFNPWVGKISSRREWLPTPVFLPGEFLGQKSLASYSPWKSDKEPGTNEQLTHTRTHTHISTVSGIFVLVLSMASTIQWGSWKVSLVNKRELLCVLLDFQTYWQKNWTKIFHRLAALYLVCRNK